LPEGAPWFSLISIKQQSEQLYLRYRCTGSRSDGSSRGAPGSGDSGPVAL